MQARRFVRTFALTSCVSAFGANAGAFELTWTAPPGCPDRAWADARLRDEAEGEITSSSLDARVRLFEHDGGWSVQIEAIQAERRGVRRVEGASCRELGEVAVVIVAMALRDDDDALVTSEEWQEEAPTDGDANGDIARSSEPTTEPRAHEGADEAPLSRDDSGWFARAGALFDVGTLPEPRLGPTLQGGRRFGDWSVEARLSGLFPATTQLSNDNVSGVGGRFFFADALASLCFAPRLDARVEGSLCAGAGLGVLFAEGFGVDDARSTTRWQFVTQLELGVAFRFTRRWALRPSVAAFLPLDRQSYAIENVGTLYTPELVSLRTGLTLAFDF